LKLDGSGNVVWQKTHGGSSSDSASSIKQTSEGGYIVAGDISSFGAVLVLKLDTNGEISDCPTIGISTSDSIVNNTSAVVTNTNVAVRDYDLSPQTTASLSNVISADEADVCSNGPLFVRTKRASEPGGIIGILGYGFGDTQGDSIVHIGWRTFDSSSRKIKLWSDTWIRIRLPNYSCKWFRGKDYKREYIWVTVGGIDSNHRFLRVVKPSTCP
jgi:hypothetical protein